MMAKVSVRGVIVPNDDKWIYDLFEIDATSPRDIDNEINKAKGEDLEVEINSPGGSVFAGSEIYTALKSYQGNVTVKVVGVAASAASIIAMAGKKILMSPTAQMMIHNVSSIAAGDYRDLQHEANVLKNYNDTIANAYMLKTGMPKEELLSMMDNETWLTPEKALENRFIDEIMFMSSNVQLVASIGTSMLLPQTVINKVRSIIKQQPVNVEPPNLEDQAVILMQKKAQAKLNLLKLGGLTHE